MAYSVSTSIHLFGTGIPLNETIKRHVEAGFKFLDFNFLDWQDMEDSPLLNDCFEAWIDSAGDMAARLLHDVGVALVNTSKNGKVFDN